MSEMIDYYTYAELDDKYQKMEKSARMYKQKNYEKILWKDKAKRIIKKLWEKRNK